MAIANRMARAIYKILSGDKFKDIGYKRGDPHEQKIKNLIGQLKSLGVNILHHNHQLIVSQQRMTIDETGVIKQ